MYYFAYASNLSRAQMKQRCPDSKPLFKATLPNYKLVFSGYSRSWHGATATIRVFNREKVPGAVYEVSELCMKQLDRYEAGYSRLYVMVFDEDGTQHEAVTFIRATQAAEDKPSEDYLKVIRQGYRDWEMV